MSRTSTTRPASGTTPASCGTTSSRARPTRSSRRTRASRSVYILTDKETYGNGIATLFETRRQEARDPTVPGTPAAGTRTRRATTRSRPRSSSRARTRVFLGGIICNNGGKLIKDLRAGSGSNVTDLRPRRLHADDAATIKTVGPGRRRACSSASRASRRAADGRRARRSSTDFTKANGKAAGSVHELRRAGNGGPADRDRRSRRASEPRSRSSLFNQDVTDGILGNFTIDENGDTTLGTVSVGR